MSDEALYLGILAMLAAAYSLYGGHFARAFGTDPSRETPAKEHGRRGAGLCLCAHLIVCVVSGLLIGETMAGRLGKTGALLVAALGGVCLLAPLTMGALFVSVRCEGLSGAAAYLLGPAVGRAVSLVQMLVCAAVLGGARTWLPGLCLVQAMTLAEMIAPRLGRESSIRPIAFGGALLTAAAACAGVLGATAYVPKEILLNGVLLLIQGILLLAVFCRQIRRLLVRAVPVFAPSRLRTALKALVLCALAAAFGAAGYFFPAAAQGACVLFAAMSLALCAAWLREIGRSCIGLYFAFAWLFAGCAAALFLLNAGM